MLHLPGMKSYSFLILTLWLGTCAVTSMAASTLSASEVRQILMEFYNETGGPRWNNNSGWGSTIDYCDGWYGVTCGSNHDVWQIDASFNSLSGSLPTSWSSLTQMTQFYAYSTSLSGSLPTSWSSLTKMTQFYADSTSLSGSL